MNTPRSTTESPKPTRIDRDLTSPPRRPFRSVEHTLAPLEAIAARSESLLPRHQDLALPNGGSRLFPRYVFIGPQGGGSPIRVGLFAGIHGDEPEGVHGLLRFLTLLDLQPRLAKGFALFIYPVCNPTGFEDNTRHSRSGKDLNRQFWSGSAEPEVTLLENEIREYDLHGMISLHADNASDGFYAYARGALLTRQLLEPALRAAEDLLPLNRQPLIDGFHARDGVITDCFEGVLGAAPKTSAKPFEVILESPQHTPQFLQELAFAASLRAILEEYRKFISYAANL